MMMVRNVACRAIFLPSYLATLVGSVVQQRAKTTISEVKLGGRQLRQLRQLTTKVLPKVSIEMLGLRVVGVSHYALVDPFFRERLQPGEPVVVVPEPENKYDPKAIAVYIKGKHVGYISRELQHIAEPYFGPDQWVLAKIGAFQPGDGSGSVVASASAKTNAAAATLATLDTAAPTVEMGTNIETIAMRLTEHGLTEYAENLEQYGFVLGGELTEAALTEMGITRKIHRRRILAAVKTKTTHTINEPGGGEKLLPFATLCHAQFWSSE